MNESISVILTAWQRPHLLEEQVERILDQTVAPQEIVLWYNSPPKKFGVLPGKQLTTFKNSKHVKKIVCDHNFGIFPRFSIAPIMEGSFVAIFDDDTMPGSKWFENCLNHIESAHAILGTIGLRYLSLDNQSVVVEQPRMGWHAKNNQLEFVDVVGHAWFFKKEWSHHFWNEPPASMNYGEDIHFCAMLQRHGIRAACPPHPENDKELWGSVKPDLGIDRVAISTTMKKRDNTPWRCIHEEVQRGFKPMLMPSRTS